MNNQNITFKDLVPLLSMIGICFAVVIARQFLYGMSFFAAMIDFMAAFFLVFGALKVVNLQGFVIAYEKYDLVTKIFKPYAYIYPFIEITLGLAYLFKYQIFSTSVVTLVVMMVSALGVLHAMMFQSERLMCACLGDLLKVPLTYVTLTEDIVMATMAAYMIWMYW